MLQKRVLLLPIIFALAFIVLQPESFFENVLLYASGAMLGSVHTSQWQLVLLNIFVFLLFLIPLSFRRKAGWKEKGLFSAFIISLFVEMYGIPLSIFAAYSYFNPVTITAAEQGSRILVTLDFFGTQLGISYWALFGYLLIGIGAVVIGLAWWKLYNSKKEIETTGIYSISRHPQYLGFFFVIWGWTISWPSILTLVMAAILTIAYHYASCREEKLLEKEFGKKFLQYRQTTPMYA